MSQPQPTPTTARPLVDGPVRRIGVLRALMLGDMLCAVPTLRAFRAHWPQAEMVLIGLPWARHWALRQRCIQHFIEFPGWPGLPEQFPRTALLPHFLRRMQAERFDLLVQLHGTGEVVNPMIGACGARQVAGFAEPGCYSADTALHVPWPRQGQEIQRLLAVVDHLGIPRRGTHLEWPMKARDRAAAAELVPVGASLACIHPGARSASHRWPPRNFAVVGDRLAREGFRVVLTGSTEEAPIAAEVASRMRHPSINLAGRTDLWCLGAVVEAAAVVITHDTGMSHVTAAIGTPSVVVCCGSESDVARWSPLDVQRHVCLWKALDECAQGIEPELVAAIALRQGASRSHTRPSPRDLLASQFEPADPRHASSPRISKRISRIV